MLHARETSGTRVPSDQYQDMNCDALNAERTRLLAERDDLNKPQLSMTDAEREAGLARVNSKFAGLVVIALVAGLVGQVGAG